MTIQEQTLYIQCTCDECGWQGYDCETAIIENIEMRVSPGEFMPVGACPECGELVDYPDDKAPIETPQHMLYVYEQLLDAIATYPANGNSEPDVMATALDLIMRAAREKDASKLLMILTEHKRDMAMNGNEAYTCDNI